MRGGLAGLAITAALAFAPAANATTFIVDTKKDLLDANQVDGICAADNGKCSVRAATMAANGNPGLDNIDIPAGTYELTQPADDTPSSLEGDLDLDEGVTIDGAGPSQTIIRQTVADRVITSNAAPAGLVPGALDHRSDDHGRAHPRRWEHDRRRRAGGGLPVRDRQRDGARQQDPGPRSRTRSAEGIAALGPATLIVQNSKITGNAVEHQGRDG